MSVPSLGSITHGPGEPKLELPKCEGAPWGVAGEPSSGCASMIGAAGKSPQESHGRLRALQSLRPTAFPPEPPPGPNDPLLLPPKVSPAADGPVVCPVFAQEAAPVTAASRPSVASARQTMEYTTPG
jgi:hypothetical protein